MLVDRPVQVSPLAGTLTYVSSTNHRSPGAWPARPGSLDELRGETLHPPVGGDVINSDTALGKQLLNVPVGQAIPQV